MISHRGTRAVFGARGADQRRRTTYLEKIDATPHIEALGEKLARHGMEALASISAGVGVAMFAASPFSVVGRSSPPARLPIFQEPNSGLRRQVHPEISVRFDAHLNANEVRALLRSFDLDVIRPNPLIANKVVAASSTLKSDPECSFEIAALLSEHPAVVFATPIFTSQYLRHAPVISDEQWHLRNEGKHGQKKGEDVRVEPAWATTLGAGVTVALLDDGVDVAHPSLADRVWRDPEAPHPRGRDFFVDPSDPGHHDPRPKTWNHPFDDREGNDIHGTACAGLIAGNGAHGVSGLAPECTLLPVKIFHAKRWAGDERVGSAIEFAALRGRADVISCSWGCGPNNDVEDALATALERGRDGKGCVVVCSVGNRDGGSVEFPANMDGVIAAGASTDTGGIAAYSNQGKEIAVVAPSSGGIRRVFTSDVSAEGRGWNPDGITTDRFGGTSAAAAMVAGAAALLIAARPGLRAREVREILMETADPIGTRRASGAGRVNLEKALRLARRGP